MQILKADFDRWHVEYTPDDGARITVLKYSGLDLLTAAPTAFRPPDRFFGYFETRPVFGYDDCFPTVDLCTYPEGDFQCRDHGELCWQNWKAERSGNNLIFSTDCRFPHVTFNRIMNFGAGKLNWKFEVVSHAAERIFFLHVMHALFPLKMIEGIEFPGCEKIIDEVNSEETGLKSAAELGEHLLAFLPGSFGMYLLQYISEGSLKLRLRSGYSIEILFGKKMFPTLGVWWNHGGYPETGVLREECAFEPIPGTCSDLSKSFRDGVCLSVNPDEKISWDIDWVISENSQNAGAVPIAIGM